MKTISFLWLIMTSGLMSYGQFEGAAFSSAGNDTVPAFCLVLEDGGRFQLFSGNVSYKGVWNAVNKNKVELKSAGAEPADLFVISGKDERNLIYFQNFATKKAFFSSSNDGNNKRSFRPVYKDDPRCPYETSAPVRISREDFNSITIAMNIPPDVSGIKKTLYTLYTYPIPGKYDGVYIAVNENAFLTQQTWTLEYREQRYFLNTKYEVEKNKTGDATPVVLAAQLELLNQAKINALKKEHRLLRTLDIAVITPSITRQAITIEAEPLLTIDCPEADPFPPVAPGR